MRLSDLMKKRDGLKHEARKIIKAAEDANRAPEENEQNRLDEIRGEIEQLETRMRNQALFDEIDRRAEGETITGDQRWDEQLRGFRLTRLIASTFEPTIDAGLEREIVAEQSRRSGRASEGFLVPFDCMIPRPQRLERRVLTVAGDGSNLVGNVVLADQFIDALRPMAAATRLGARSITVERTDIALPRRDARTPTAAWFVENNTITSGDQSFDQVTGTPRHLGLITEFGRKTMIQTTPDIEMLTREHLLTELGVGVDLAVMKGSGAGGQPTGITQTPNIGTKDSSGAAPTWAEVLDVIATVEGADVPPESLGWAANAKTKAKFRSTTKVASDAGAGFIMDEARMLDGAPVAVTSQLVGGAGSPPADGEAIFGAWNQVIVAMWGGMEILVNPYESTAYSKGNVSVRGIVDADVLVRYPAAFYHWEGIGVS
jgi:HK97 family phage major capsid protein